MGKEDKIKACPFCERLVTAGKFDEHEKLCKRQAEAYRAALIKSPLVLMDMLTDLRFFMPARTPEEVALANYGKNLLRKCGVLNQKNRLKVIMALFGPEEIKADMV